MDSASAQREANDRLWLRRDLVSRYTGTELRPVEAVLLRRHADALSTRVLEIGSGAGRLTGHLAEIAEHATALDVSPHMLEALQASYPTVETQQGDLRDLGSFANGSFEAIVAGFNIADILDDRERADLLDAIHRILTPAGLLIISGHNLGAEHLITEPLEPRLRNPKGMVALLLWGRRWRRNRKRLLPHERRADNYAILNDVAHDFEGLHYYIGSDAQVRQLAEHGFEFVECLDPDGNPVAPGEAAPHATELHYVARRLDPSA